VGHRGRAPPSGILAARGRRCLTRARVRLSIAGIFWNTWLTHHADPGNAFDHSGLVRLDADGRIVAKPALRAWREVVRRELARR
jgi:hypothetical protein